MADERETHQRFIRAAFEQARKSYNEGGLPIGAVMVENSTVIAVGHNRRVQDGDPTAHGRWTAFGRLVGALAMTALRFIRR